MKVLAHRSFFLKMEEGVRVELEKGKTYEMSADEFDKNKIHGLTEVQEDKDAKKK